MEHFFIVTNDGKDTEFVVTGQVKELLEAAGKVCTLCKKDRVKRIIKEEIPQDIDCAIVIGGDGSFIEAARALEGRDIPILGINMGTLGYLTEVEVNHNTIGLPVAASAFTRLRWFSEAARSERLPGVSQ